MIWNSQLLHQRLTQMQRRCFKIERGSKFNQNYAFWTFICRALALGWCWWGVLLPQYGWLRTDGQFEGAWQTYHVRHTSNFTLALKICSYAFIITIINCSKWRKNNGYSNAFCEIFRCSCRKLKQMAFSFFPFHQKTPVVQLSQHQLGLWVLWFRKSVLATM